MAQKSGLTTEQHHFFSAVQKAVLANPFSAERTSADAKIAGMFPDISPSEMLQKAVIEVRKRVDGMEAENQADLKKFSGSDRDILAAGFLFDIFHRFMDEFDQLILDQIKNQEKPVKVPFANEVLSLFRRRGFDAGSSAHFFSLCFQLRRAYFFIDRGLVGRSPCMKKLREDLWNNVFTCDLDLYNQYLCNRMEDFSTLILGETGTGKGAAAMAIGRSGYIPFDEKAGCFAESFTRSCVTLNLSQFPENLIESELFGHKKGSFTGAAEDHKGVFDHCSRYGSIFLDEIGEVSIPVQIKLLKVLEEREFCPVGSHKSNRFEGRIIAATNRSIDTIREKNLLRDDFFYRLCSDIIEVPPLYQRINEDPGELDDLLAFTIERIIGRPSSRLVQMTKKNIFSQLGKDYHWPGNVRELNQCVRRILLKRRYENLFQKQDPETPPELAKTMSAGNIDAKNLVKAYCKMLYDQLGTYGEVARKTGLDRRTVKRHITE